MQWIMNMQALDLVLNRVSCSKLQEPAPTIEQRVIMYQAALRAADHANLQPWRFLEIEGKGLHLLGELFASAAQTSDSQVSEAQSERLKKKPLRAPLVIAAIAKHIPHPKVPQWEQLISAGCAVQNMINAAFAQSVGAYWRTGNIVEDPVVIRGLGLEPSETLIGFIYLGTPAIALKPTPKIDYQNFFSAWPSQ